jgi:hypothetical protein
LQLDFHYYATYSAAYIAGYSHEESSAIAYSAQFVDCCTVTLLDKVLAPKKAATTQMQLELMNARTDRVGLQNITRIWAAFHFLPKDLSATKAKCGKRYLNKYRLICGPNGELLADTVNLAKGGSLEAAGVAMHVLADTWAHMYFAGTPSLVINNTNYHLFEIVQSETDGETERQIKFSHNPSAQDDPETGFYVSSVYQGNENSIMNLGHGRIGHLPDYSYIKYKYLPAWGEYEETVKDNPSDYYHAFCQMVYALKFLRGEIKEFETDTYAFDEVRPYESEIKAIIAKRQTDASADWKAFGEALSGRMIADFDIDVYEDEYKTANGREKESTPFGRFIAAALAHKSMVANRIFKSGNLLAGFSKEVTRD